MLHSFRRSTLLIDPTVGQIATVNVAGNRWNGPFPPQFLPARPDYLADLTDPSMPGPGPHAPPVEKWDISLAVGGLNVNGALTSTSFLAIFASPAFDGRHYYSAPDRVVTLLDLSC